MSASLSEYHSISSKGYQKHPNIEILGVDSLPLKVSQSILSVEKDFERQSVIKEEENQCEPQPKYEKSPTVPTSFAQHMMERQEVSSVYLHTPKCNPNQPLTYSYISVSNPPPPPRGILKRSLIELQKKKTASQEDANCDKQLYLQLEKQRQLRRELEKTYKQLLSEMQKKERRYSVDLEGVQHHREPHSGRRRQFSRRTLNNEKSHDGLTSYEEIETQKGQKNIDVKTVKLNIPEKSRPSPQAQTQNQQPYHSHQEEQDTVSEQENIHSREHHLDTQKSGDSEPDYFRDQRQFQQRVMAELRVLNKRIEQIDNFLLEKEREEERERLQQEIELKQQQIKRVMEENERLRNDKDKEEDVVELNFMKKMNTNSLYFFLIIIMAIVAIS